jgi:hypothetical protein
MKHIIITALAAIAGLALSCTAVTAQTTITTTAPAATTQDTAPATVTSSSKAKKIMYTGSVTAVDATSITVQGAASKPPLTLMITSATKFSKGATALTDIAVGDHVSGSYTKDASGVLTAASVHKKAAKKTTTTTAPAFFLPKRAGQRSTVRSPVKNCCRSPPMPRKVFFTSLPKFSASPSTEPVPPPPLLPVEAEEEEGER